MTEEQLIFILEDPKVKQEVKDKVMQQAWRQTFTTGLGRIVFNDLMVDLQLNNDIAADNVAANALQREAKHIIACHMGMDSAKKFKGVTDAILSALSDQ